MTYIDKQPRAALYQNSQPIQGAFAFAAPSVVYTANVSASDDPFTGKTNKFAETQCVYFVSTVAFHFKWGTSSITSATTSDTIIPANTPFPMVVESTAPYLRVIPTTGTARYWVVEVL